MKVVFMGTPDFAVNTLQAIMDAGHEVTGVVTQPDKPKGRGKAMQCPPVKELALEHGIEVFQPVRVKEESAIEKIRAMEPDVIVVVAFGQILNKPILDMPQYGCVNVHASLLPKYRGSAPIQWAVINGEKESGVTTQLMNEGVDTGDILMMDKLTLDEKETGGSLFDRLADMGADLLIKTLEAMENGTITRTPQNEAEATHAKMLDKKMGVIDFSKSAEEIERLVRGLNPWPSAFTGFGGKTLKVWDAKVIPGDREGAFGEVVEVTKDQLLVKTGSGLLALEEVQVEGKKRMPVDVFLRGNTIEAGTILGK